MSKRKRKQDRRRKASNGKPSSDSAKDLPEPEARPSREREGESGDGHSASAADSNQPPKKSQRGLLLFGLALLGFAIFLNWKRLNDTKLPGPLPFPESAVVVSELTKPQSAGGKRFVRVEGETSGVDFVHPVDADHAQAFLYFSGMASGGTAIGDVNGDGRPDLFIASGPRENRLYIQGETAFTFTDVTDKAGVGGEENWATGATMVDVNADGRLDIYVANYDAPNALYLNQGNGRFIDMAYEFGLNLTDASLEGVFADYDGDSWLDMYLVTYRYENPAGMPSKAPIVAKEDGTTAIDDRFARYYEITDDAIGFGTVGRADGLMKNRGDGTFVNASADAGIYGIGHGQSATWWDFDDDGKVDLHVGNDFNDPDRLLRNNGNATFTDVVIQSTPHITWFSMGTDVGDLNGDGLFDLLSSDMSSTTHFKQKTTMGAMGDSADFLANAVPRQYMRNALLLNTGTPRFKEAAFLAGLESTDWTWCVKIADLDCDGRQDVFFTNGSVRSFTDSDRSLKLEDRVGKTEWDIYRDTEPLNEANLAFRNGTVDGELAFEDVSKEWGLDHLGVSMSAAHGDFDQDGDLDLVVANVGEPIAIYRNDSADHQRLVFRLHGRGGNRFAVGARIRIVTSAGEQVQELQPSRGFLASNEPLIHFGIPEEAASGGITAFITWPNRGVQELKVQPGRRYDVTEPDGSIRLTPPGAKAVAPMFVTTSADESLAHVENVYDDYAVQSLIPHRMSRLGPALASADVDGDGDMDFFVGGAAGQPGRVLLVDKSTGGVSANACPALDADSAAEDMGAVWFDIDQDGDEDLFVASGGNEFDANSPNYLCRLYLNDGKGGLTRDEKRLPSITTSAGPVAACDFDQDGDVDLFVGGRQVPGAYPLPGQSFLLRNDDGTLVDATEDTMPAVAKIGMVTGSLWSDADNDGDLDLLLTEEWGSIRLLRNEENKFVDASSDAGLDKHRGWWTGITPADVDGDGDVDYVATNLGLNTKYHADDTHPFRLYYGDFEGTGKSHLVEAEYEDETLFPVRGKSCSTHAMSTLADKFPTYREFALASLEDIYTPECLEEAFQVSANWLESVVLINDGQGGFTFKELPTEAQLSPCFGCVVHDWNADGKPDVFLAQNFFSPQPETGNFDGGLGCLLMGNGDGTFSPMHTRESGIIIPDDAKASVLAELNGDGVPDVLVASNNGLLKTVISQSSDAKFVRLDFGTKSAASLAGIRVRVDGAVHEVAGGGGYLSQQPPYLFLPAADEEREIEVLVPGKEPKAVTVPVGESSVRVRAE